MPTYMVTDPDTGRKVRLTGDSPPTEQELEKIFSTLPPMRQPSPAAPAPKERGLMGEIAGGLETAGTMLSGAIAEPAAGIAGLATGVLTGDPAAASAVVEGVRDRLSYEPKTPEGQRNLQAIGGVIEPAAEAFGAAEDYLGETTLEATGSPALAAAAKTLPTALLTAIGFRGGRGGSRIKSGRELNNAIKEAAPTSEQLRSAAREVFKEIDDSGARVKPDAFGKLTKDIERSARQVGARPRSTPEVYGVINEFKDVAKSGGNVSLDEILELRKVAQNKASSIDPSVKAPVLSIIDEIDDFLDSDSILDTDMAVGQELKAARQMWGRAKKSEAIDEMVQAAKDTASGFENGLRIEARKLWKNKKRSRFFSADEIDALKKVSEGTRTSNLAKLIGRLGVSEGQAINIVNPAVGGGLAAAALGTPAGIAVPVIGQVSKNLAQKLTKNNARLADQVVRAGSNAEQIAKAYLNSVPKAQRSTLELAELMVRNEVNLSTARSALARDAAETAKQFRAALVGAAGASSMKPEGDENE